MSKLVGHGAELYRFYSSGMIVAVMNDGTLHRRVAGSGWKLYMRRKPTISLEDWRARKMAMRDKIAAEEPWRLKVTALPSFEKVMKWMDDGGCKTPTGEWVEPDGTGTDGAPSWARLYGLI
jgi:hypothetical protein